MEEAELAAHANTWIPSETLEPRHGRTAQVPARHADKRTPHCRSSDKQLSGVQAFRDLARRYNPRVQVRSLAQLQEMMHFDFGAGARWCHRSYDCV